MTLALISAPDVMPVAVQAGEERITYLADLTTQTGVSLTADPSSAPGTLVSRRVS